MIRVPPFPLFLFLLLNTSENTNGCNAFSLHVPSAPVSKSDAPEQPSKKDVAAAATTFPQLHLSPPPPPVKKKGKAAIILNTNARSVSHDLAPIARAVFGRENVFCTSTEDEGKRAASQIINNRNEYSLVIPVGGDGTLSSMINFMCDDIIARDAARGRTTTVEDAMKELPLIGYIPLGTGNGVGSVVGCRVEKVLRLVPGAKGRKKRRVEYIMQCLKRLSEETTTYAGSSSAVPPTLLRDEKGRVNDVEIVTLPMIEVIRQQIYDDEDFSDADAIPFKGKGDLCFFAGVGFDSLMLNDFKRIKAWSKRKGILTRALSSVTGYCVALVVKTLPKCISYGAHKVNVTLSSRDDDTVWVDHRRGDFVRRCFGAEDDDGEKSESRLLYSGTTGILAAGTSPFYGGGLRLFPFARLTTDKMHLRIGRINPLVGFINIPNIFAGSYRDKSDRFGCLDFIGSDFEVEVSGENSMSGKEGRSNGYPFQHSGESMGHTERFRLRVVEHPVRFVSFMKKRVVHER